MCIVVLQLKMATFTFLGCISLSQPVFADVHHLRVDAARVTAWSYENGWWVEEAMKRVEEEEERCGSESCFVSFGIGLELGKKKQESEWDGVDYMLGFVGFVSMGRRWNNRERERGVVAWDFLY